MGNQAAVLYQVYGTLWIFNCSFVNNYGSLNGALALKSLDYGLIELSLFEGNVGSAISNVLYLEKCTMIKINNCKFIQNGRLYNRIYSINIYGGNLTLSDQVEYKERFIIKEAYGFISAIEEESYLN